MNYGKVCTNSVLHTINFEENTKLPYSLLDKRAFLHTQEKKKIFIDTGTIEITI